MRQVLQTLMSAFPGHRWRCASLKVPNSRKACLPSFINPNVAQLPQLGRTLVLIFVSRLRMFEMVEPTELREPVQDDLH